MTPAFIRAGAPAAALFVFQVFSGSVEGPQKDSSKSNSDDDGS